MSAISDDKGNNVKTQNFIQYVVPERVGASIAVCYVAQYHAADEYFPDYMVGLMRCV